MVVDDIKPSLTSYDVICLKNLIVQLPGAVETLKQNLMKLTSARRDGSAFGLIIQS